MTAARSVTGSRARRGVRLAVAGLFTASGALHLAKPSVFEGFLPGWTPHPVAVNAAAGALELVCAYGLVTRRQWGGPVSAAALLAVWPSNLWFAVSATREAGPGSPKAAVAWARMPLQLPMIWAVLSPVEDAARR